MIVLGPLPCRACGRIVRWERHAGALVLLEGQRIHACPSAWCVLWSRDEHPVMIT